MNTREIGNIAEKQAVQFLISNKFYIITTNFYTKFGEIDIIAKKDNIYHFIEVKSGQNFEPIYNVTNQKLNKIIKTIHIYLQKNKIISPYQIDVITIYKEIKFIQNITMF